MFKNHIKRVRKKKMKRRLLFLAYVNSWDFFHSGMLMKNVITQFGKKLQQRKLWRQDWKSVTTKQLQIWLFYSLSHPPSVELFFKLILFYLTKIKTTKVLLKCLVEENLLIIIISIIRTCSGITNLMIDDSKKPSSSSGITFFIVFHCGWILM